MSEYGTFTEPGTIVFLRLLPGPIERVWAYLTEPDKRGQWLASGEMELKVGGSVELHFSHADLSPVHEEIPDKYKGFQNGASFSGHITRCEPPRLLAFTWRKAGARIRRSPLNSRRRANRCCWCLPTAASATNTVC